VEKNRERGTFNMCPVFKDVVPAMIQANTKLFIDHLGTLQKHFSLYLKEEDVSKPEWLKTHLKLITSLD
jgi:hypothetical protein